MCNKNKRKRDKIKSRELGKPLIPFFIHRGSPRPSLHCRVQGIQIVPLMDQLEFIVGQIPRQNQLFQRCFLNSSSVLNQTKVNV